MIEDTISCEYQCSICDSLINCDQLGKKKVFLSFNQQVNILKRRNINFRDELNAEFLLQNLSYYGIINAYKELFLVSLPKELDNYNGCYFEEILKVYDFDKRIGSILLKYILKIESTLRTVLSYEISQNLGYIEKDYLDVSKYNAGKTIYKNNGEKSCERTKTFMYISEAMNSRYSEPIIHYRDDLKNVPPWILVNELNFGKTIYWYKLCKTDIRECVMNRILKTDQSLSFTTRHELFIKCLNICSEYRNIIAHGGRVINSKLLIELPKLPLLAYVDNDFYNESMYNSNIGKKGFLSLLISMVVIFSNRTTVKYAFISEMYDQFEELKNIEPELFKRIISQLNIPENFFFNLIGIVK